MTRTELCHELADVNERLYDIGNQLEKIAFNIMVEKDSSRKDWFINAQENLLQEKQALTVKHDALMSELYP